MQYVTFKKVNGNLLITLLPEGREYITEAKDDPEKNIGSDAFMLDLFDHEFGNGWTSLIDVVALSDAVYIADSDDVERDEDHRPIVVKRAYWFPAYTVKCPVEELLALGEVTFVGVELKPNR